ncbi:MAG TPA: hypothetical protein VGL46_15050 [Pseudonocardiaceae bacterium]
MPTVDAAQVSQGDVAALAAALDLPTHTGDDVLQRVEQGLNVRLDRAGEVRKRRSIGAATDRGTWIRIEQRRVEKMGGQGFNGPEAAAVLTGIAKPAWRTSLAWAEPCAGRCGGPMKPTWSPPRRSSRAASSPPTRGCPPPGGRRSSRRWTRWRPRNCAVRSR